MKKLLMCILVVCVSGCVTTTTTPPSQYVPKANYDAPISQAAQERQNLYKKTDSEIKNMFGKPRTIEVSPNDPSGQTQVWKYQSSTARFINLHIKGGVVVDVEYGSLINQGHGHGRKQKARLAAYYAELEAKKQAAAESLAEEAVEGLVADTTVADTMQDQEEQEVQETQAMQEDQVIPETQVMQEDLS